MISRRLVLTLVTIEEGAKAEEAREVAREQP